MLVTCFSVFTLREKFSPFLIWLFRYYLFTLFLFITRWFLTLICCQRYVSCMTVWINVCLSIYYATTHHSSHWKVREERKRERERGCLSPRARAPLEYEWFFLLLSLLLAFEVWWRQSYVTGREARQTGLFTPAPSPPSLPPSALRPPTPQTWTL